MGNDNLSHLNWSDWLDFEKLQIIANVPEKAGVFKLHANMKILLIDGSNNLKNALLNCIDDSCTKNARRFSFALTESIIVTKNQLLAEYLSKHDGKLPMCMEINHN